MERIPRLRALARARGWDRFEQFDGHFADVARRLSRETGQPCVSVTRRTFDRWTRGGIKSLPRAEATCRVLETMFGMSIERLFELVPVADPDPSQRSTTVFQALVRRLHLHTYEAFAHEFERAAKRLARERDRPRLALATVSSRTFDRWMSGDLLGTPHADNCLILEHLLGTPVAELFADGSLPHVVAEETPAARSVVRPDAVGEFRTWPLAEIPGDEVMLAPTSVVTAADVHVIRTMLASLTASDHQFGGGHAGSMADEYLGRVVRPCLHAGMTDPVRREMFSVAAEFAMRVSWTHFDMGRRSRARTFLAFALSCAEETEDTTLTAWVMAMHGLQSVWAGNVQDAVDRTGAAVALARRGPTKARAFVEGKHALALSLTGDSRRTLRILGQVRDRFDRAEDQELPWTRIYDRAYVHDEEGHCFRNLRLGNRAAAAEQEAMLLRGPQAFTRLRAFSLSIQAIGHVQAGEVDRACAVAHELLPLSAGFASTRVRSRLSEVLAAIGAHADLRMVRELRDAAVPVLRPDPDRPDRTR